MKRDDDKCQNCEHIGFSMEGLYCSFWDYQLLSNIKECNK